MLPPLIWDHVPLLLVLVVLSPGILSLMLQFTTTHDIMHLSLSPAAPTEVLSCRVCPTPLPAGGSDCG